MPATISPESEEYVALIAAEEEKIKQRKRTEDLTSEQRECWQSLGNRRRRGVMPTANLASWSRHHHEFWAEHAQNPAFPAWFRVMAIAYGSDRANGHTNLEAGELQKRLGGDPSGIRKAIKHAVEKGLLAASSSTRCLVLPGREKIVGTKVFEESPIWGGTGNPFDRCDICHV